MKTKVMYFNIKNDERKVLCSTSYGNVTLSWRDETPIVNSTYYVEVDIEEILEWGKNIYPSDRKDFIFENKDNDVFLCGVFESIDDDGYGTLRLGDDIIPFISTGVPFDVKSRIEITVNKISAHTVSY
ncbi:MAG: hypothetical protein GX786_02840 [Clostridiales bacterium]|nr:hypothetical protein [Clostridiales bacterium]